MPPRKKKVESEIPAEKAVTTLGWCLIPQHDVCPGETPSLMCKCACHGAKSETKNDPCPNCGTQAIYKIAENSFACKCTYELETGEQK